MPLLLLFLVIVTIATAVSAGAVAVMQKLNVRIVATFRRVRAAAPLKREFRRW